MRIKLDNLKEPTKTICVHCLSIAIRQEPIPYYRYSYKCNCGKLGSSGLTMGVPNFDLFINDLDKIKENEWVCREGCGLHSKCGIKKNFLVLIKEDDNYFIELRQYKTNVAQ